jgi:uncharacterized membrane protein YqiK
MCCDCVQWEADRQAKLAAEAAAESARKALLDAKSAQAEPAKAKSKQPLDMESFKNTERVDDGEVRRRMEAESAARLAEVTICPRILCCDSCLFWCVWMLGV